MAPADTISDFKENSYQNLGACLAIIFGVAACTAAGAAVDLLRARREVGKPAKSGRRLQGWVLGMLVSSYGLLFPGLFLKLFESSTDFVLYGVVQNVSAYDESVVSLIARLWKDGMVLGSILVSLYAIVIPLLKVVLLLLGQCFQDGTPKQVKLARLSIKAVQRISKWACPDMFAYILLAYLLRGLNKPPSLQSGMTLDLGFTCFCIFCVASTVSSLGICLPGETAGERAPTKAAAVDDKDAPAEASDGIEQESSTSTATISEVQGELSSRESRFGALVNRFSAPLVLLLTLAFSFFFVVGVSRPSMSLNMDMELLYKVRPDLAAMKLIIDSLHLDELLQKEVSVWECMMAQFGWIAEGDVNALISLVLYSVFAVLLPCLDMCLTMFIAVLGALMRSDGEQTSKLAQRANDACRLSRKLRKLSMLDVSIMGCFVVVATLGTLRKKGVIVEARSGVVALLFAELCHISAAVIARRSLQAASFVSDARSRKIMDIVPKGEVSDDASTASGGDRPRAVPSSCEGSVAEAAAPAWVQL